MPQNTARRTTARRWDFLEPAMNPEYARTMHGKIVSAGAGLFVIYPKGQILRQKTDGTNQWAKEGTAGFTGPVRVLKYPIIVNDAGHYQMGATWFSSAGVDIFEGSTDMYYRGYFYCQDMVSTNEVQTETVTATGGTRTLTVTDVNGVAATTTALAFNATAATIQAALEALSNVAPPDIVVTGAGPYIYTFGGTFANRNIPLIIINTGALTGGTATMTETAPLSTVGRLIRGTYTEGILALGEATPV